MKTQLRLLLLISSMSLVQSCKKDLSQQPDLPKQILLDTALQVTTNDVVEWKQQVGKDAPAEVRWDAAEIATFRGQSVIKVPLLKNSALFFTREAGDLRVYAYKWVDDAPGAKQFTGKIGVYDFKENKIINFVYDLNGIVTTTVSKGTESNAVSASKIKVNLIDIGQIISKVWCWLIGQRWNVATADCTVPNPGPSNPDDSSNDSSVDWFFYSGISFGGGGGTSTGSAGGGGGAAVWVSEYVPPTDPGCPVAVTKPKRVNQVPGYTPPDCTGKWSSVKIILPVNPVDNNPDFHFSDFSNLNSPVDSDKDPVDANKYAVTFLPYTVPSSGRLLAKSKPRNRPAGVPEDMQYGFNADKTKIVNSELNKSDDYLFNGMSTLFHSCTYFDSGLKGVGDQMIQRFRNRTGGSYENTVLNQRVGENPALINFINYNFGEALNSRLKAANGNINNVPLFEVSGRPVFNSMHDKFHGLQILINDTESTEIQLDEFNGPVNGNWSATITLTIRDNFGLDLHDAITYQSYHLGFPDWWLLQHDRGYVPFETVIHVKVKITGNYNN